MTLEGKNVFTQPIIKLLNYFPELNDKAFSLSVYFLSQNKPERTELSGTFKFLTVSFDESATTDRSAGFYFNEK